MKDPPGITELLSSVASVTVAVEALRNAVAHLASVDAQQADSILRGTDQLQEYTGRIQDDLQTLRAASLDSQEIVDRLSALQPVISEVQTLSRQFNSALADLNTAVAVQLTASHLARIGRTLEGWHKRWKHDARDAEAAYQEAVRLTREIPAAYRRLTDSDLSIAGLYYYGGLSQADVGARVGLSQPTVGSRLRRIDRVVAERLLETRLNAVAEQEGWDLRTNVSISFEAFDFDFDLLARRKQDEIGIELKTSDEVAVQRVSEWSRYLSNLQPPTHVAVAVYDLSSLTAGLYVPEDIESAFQKLNRQEGGSEAQKFRDIAALLPHNLSLSAALERGRQ